MQREWRLECGERPLPKADDMRPHPTDPRLVRFAGALYLLIIFCGISAEVLLRGPLLHGTPEQIATAIGAQMGRFRLSLVADLTMLLADVALALVFFALLRRNSEALAAAAMVFRLGQAVLVGAALTALASAPQALETDPGIAVHMTRVHAVGYDVGLALFAVNCLLMALLLWRAAVPRVIAAGIAAAGVVYAAGTLTRLLAPDLMTLVEPAYAIPLIAESALCLWLLIAARV